MKELDDIDHRLLAELQSDAGRTLRALGEIVGLSPSGVQRRLVGYRDTGLLSRTTAILDPGVTPNLILAVCLVAMERASKRHLAAFEKKLLAAPEVQQVYDVSGEWDYVVVLATSGMAHHNSAAEHLLMDSPDVLRYTTLFVLNPVRTGTAIPTRARTTPFR
ncbi:Lrp/AsnC family transcriptional regulator [Actinophytocola sp.]|uniref:Lrp/AsnC family transcriptional regulator n=1 Tax=Actinophytocola sp. TaxID=1872138 RepID=UPI0025C2E31F|nr:Lrp/AsnC family transcriptional regulator [Actinophytocola sp.]